jgi:hypothetical protein
MQEHPLQDQRKVLEDEATQLELELLNMKSTYRSLHAMVGDNNTGETSDASAESEGESTREKEREPGGSPQPSGEMEDGGSDGDEFPVEVSYYGILYDTATPPETSLLQRSTSMITILSSPLLSLTSFLLPSFVSLFYRRHSSISLGCWSL